MDERAQAADLLPDTPFGTPNVPTDRYLNNRSTLATANNLLKLREGLTLTANVGYTLADNGYSMEARTLYATGEQEQILATDDNRTDLTRHRGTLALKWEPPCCQHSHSNRPRIRDRPSGPSPNAASPAKPFAARLLPPDCYADAHRAAQSVPATRRIGGRESLRLRYQHSPPPADSCSTHGVSRADRGIRSPNSNRPPSAHGRCHAVRNTSRLPSSPSQKPGGLMPCQQPLSAATQVSVCLLTNRPVPAQTAVSLPKPTAGRCRSSHLFAAKTEEQRCVCHKKRVPGRSPRKVRSRYIYPFASAHFI